MAANSSLDLVSLDFDTTKANLKNFLKSQNIFKDYDFEGSNIGVLLDVMSYNTFLNSFYLNMIASESFLDSAQLRDSVISHAKELNYLPRSRKSSRVALEPFYIATNPELTTLVIPKGTLFSGTVRGKTYNFVTDSIYINNTPAYSSANNVNVFSISKRIVPEDGTASYIENPLTIYQGNYITDTFVVDYSLENQRFVLTDPNIDTDSITVMVIEDSGSTEISYIYSSTLLDVRNIDPRYFLQPAESGKYEIVFGDDIIGRRPRNNAVVRVDYRVTAGADGNGVTLFSLDTNVVSYSGGQLKSRSANIIPALETSGGTYGGSEAESIDQIRYKAPRYFQTQERAVTTADYEILLRNKFPEIQAIAVFGGETFDPPLYGKVYVSVKLKDVDGLPDAKKIEYSNYIAPRSPAAIDALFISPENLYYSLSTNVNYNINVTAARPDQIRTSVVNTILAYDETKFNNFNVTLRNSRLINAIDSSDSSIVSNETKIVVYKKIVPFLGVSQNITIRLGVPIIETVPELAIQHSANDILSVYSTDFVFNGQTVSMEDDGNGKLRLVTKIGTIHKFVKEIGTVDYPTGTIKLIDFNIASYSGTAIRIYGVPKYDDIKVTGNNIFLIGRDELVVNVNTVRE